MELFLTLYIPGADPVFTGMAGHNRRCPLQYALQMIPKPSASLSPFFQFHRKSMSLTQIL